MIFGKEVVTSQDPLFDVVLQLFSVIFSCTYLVEINKFFSCTREKVISFFELSLNFLE